MILLHLPFWFSLRLEELISISYQVNTVSWRKTHRCTAVLWLFSRGITDTFRLLVAEDPHFTEEFEHHGQSTVPADFWLAQLVYKTVLQVSSVPPSSVFTRDQAWM